MAATNLHQELVSILIVNWNTRDLLLQCIGSINANAADVAYEIIVVDNASEDGSVAALRGEYPNVKLIASERNLGFGAANNLGMRQAVGNLVLLLNPDTLVPPFSLKAMVKFLDEHKDVGIVGPMLVGADGRMQISSFGLFPSPAEAAAHAARIWRTVPKSPLARRFLIQPAEAELWTYTRHLLGACLFVRREVMEQTRGFDESFFLFLEETDFCYRAEKCGWRMAYFTGARVVHLGEQSMQHILHRTGGLYIRSYNHFCRKHKTGLPARIAINVCLVFGAVVEAATGLVKWRSPRRAARSICALWVRLPGKAVIATAGVERTTRPVDIAQNAELRATLVAAGVTRAADLSTENITKRLLAVYLECV